MKYIREYRHNNEDEIREMTNYLKPKLNWKFINKITYMLTTYDDMGLDTGVNVYLEDNQHEFWQLFKYHPNGNLECTYEWHPNTAKYWFERDRVYYAIFIKGSDGEYIYKYINDVMNKIGNHLFTTPVNRNYLMHPKQ